MPEYQRCVDCLRFFRDWDLHLCSGCVDQKDTLLCENCYCKQNHLCKSCSSDAAGDTAAPAEPAASTAGALVEHERERESERKRPREEPWWQTNERKLKNLTRAGAGHFMWACGDYMNATKRDRTRTKDHRTYLSLLKQAHDLLEQAEELHRKSDKFQQRWAVEPEEPEEESEAV